MSSGQRPTGDGSLAIRCVLRNGCIVGVTIAPRLQPPVDRLCLGRTPAETLQLFGHLFALCRHAQSAAASAALAGALGISVPPDLQQCQDSLRRLEIVKEHGLNLMLQQPPADTPNLPPRWLACFRALENAFGGNAVYWPTEQAVEINDVAADEGLATLANLLGKLYGGFTFRGQTDWDSLLHWQAENTSAAARLLRHYGQHSWAAFGAGPVAPLSEVAGNLLYHAEPPDERSTPTWQGLPRECNAYTRQAGNPWIRAAQLRHGSGLYTRALARLVEMEALLFSLQRRARLGGQSLRLPAPTQSGGRGLAEVEASRGRLMHKAVVEDGRIRDYAILAPTEWNFHPQGLLATALLGAPVGEEVAAQIDAFLRTVDPCVDFHLVLAQA